MIQEEKKEYADIILNNNALLLQLISDILDLSKIEAGTLEFTYSEIDLNSLLTEVAQTAHLKSKQFRTGYCIYRSYIRMCCAQ